MVGCREIAVKYLKEHLKALAVDAGAEHHRHDISVNHMLPQRSLDFLHSELLAQEIALHIFFTGLCDGFDEASLAMVRFFFTYSGISHSS